MRTLFKGLMLGASVFGASGAYAIGITTCASADGLIERSEEEVWGANPVRWTYVGQLIPEDQVKIAGDATIVVSDKLNRHPELGEEHILTTVERVTLTPPGRESVTDFVLCRSVQYPEVLD